MCNKSCQGKQTPEDWHEADVVAIHKKGPVHDCENFRPISLLSVTYKLYAALILKRLQDAGAEDRITASQFGFRRGTGTREALFVARRLVETAVAQRDGHLALLALDWAKAFDSINPEAMVVGLRRFGLPEHLIEIVKNI